MKKHGTVGSDLSPETCSLHTCAHSNINRLLLGGNRVKGMSGLYMEPTIFADVEDHMFIAQEESFGPVMVVSKFNSGDVDEVGNVTCIELLCWRTETLNLFLRSSAEPMIQSSALHLVCSPVTSTKPCT